MSSDREFSALRWKEISPDDADKLEPVPVAIRANVGGDVNIEGDDGNAEVFTVAAGEILPCQPHRVLSTSTDATGIMGLYN